jgi:hypothetical protein
LAAPVSAAPIVADATPAPPPAQHVAHAETPIASGGKRTLFAYREEARAEEPRAFVVVEEPPPAVVVSAPVAAIEPPQPPAFPYRLIGTFGTREKRFAAFTRDGEVIAVRTGRNIGSDYVLRSIGIESVEVQRVADAASVRVPLGEK